jgi:hypothetical protein
MPESRSNRLIGKLRRPKTPKHSHISSTPVAKILVPPSIGSRQPRKILRSAFGKQLPCGRLILTHRSHIKHRCIKVFKAHSSQEQASEEYFFFLRRDRGNMWGRRKARAICRVSKSLLDAGRGPECRSAAAKPYDLRQVFKRQCRGMSATYASVVPANLHDFPRLICCLAALLVFLSLRARNKGVPAVGTRTSLGRLRQRLRRAAWGGVERGVCVTAAKKEERPPGVCVRTRRPMRHYGTRRQLTRLLIHLLFTVLKSSLHDTADVVINCAMLLRACIHCMIIARAVGAEV